MNNQKIKTDGGTYNLTPESSAEALKNDYRELINEFDKNVVSISREKKPSGCMCLLKITANVPTYYLESSSDTTPKSTNSLTFYVKVYNDYPATKPFVYYPSDRYLASVNAYSNGEQCTAEWHKTNSLTTIVTKTLRDIIHDPDVTDYDSMANFSMEKWQRDLEEKGKFPTVPLGTLYAKNRTVPPPTPYKNHAPYHPSTPVYRRIPLPTKVYND